MSIDKFISIIKAGGLAKIHTYSVSFTPPSMKSHNLHDILLLCDSIQLPNYAFSTNQIRTYGEIRETPYERLTDAITATFYVDANLEVKKLFEDWMSLIQDPLTRKWNYYNNYITDLNIEILDAADEKRYDVTLFECYPKSIGSINLDTSTNDIMKLSIQFQYKYYKSNYVINEKEIDSKNILNKYYNNFDEFQDLYNDYIGLNEEGDMGFLTSLE